MTNSRNKRGLIFLLAILVLTAGCAHLPGRTGRKAPPAAGHRHKPAKVLTCSSELLVNGFDEEVQQGLYAYLLWPQAGGVDPLNARALAKALFQTAPQRRCSGTMYWMVEGCDPLDAEYRLAVKDWAFLWDHYHFHRARLVLHRMGWPLSIGPLLVVGFSPMASIARPKPVLGHPEMVIDMESLDQKRRMQVITNMRRKLFNYTLKALKKNWSLTWLATTLGLFREGIITVVRELQ